MERNRVAACLPAPPAGPRLDAKKQYFPKGVAALWGFSPATIRNLFRDEPGVLRLEGMGQSHGKRSYTTFSIPESVALRVHERLAQKPLKAQPPRRDPRR